MYTLVPMTATQRSGTIERVTNVEEHVSAGLERLESPVQTQLHTTRRIEQSLLQGDGDRPETLEHLTSPQDFAALLSVLTAGAREQRIRHNARTAPTASGDDFDQRRKGDRQR